MKELIKIQSELKAPKSQYNNFGKYSYRSQEDILEALKPLLKENNCFLTISDDIVEVGGRVYVKATAKITNEKETVENTAFAREPETQKGMNEAQITGSASSYARKYALNGLFAIDDTKDADYSNTHGKDKQDAQTNKTEVDLPWIGDVEIDNIQSNIGAYKKKYPTVNEFIAGCRTKYKISKANAEVLKGIYG